MFNASIVKEKLPSWVFGGNSYTWADFQLLSNLILYSKMESAAEQWREDRKRSRDDNDLGTRDGLLMRQSTYTLYTH